MSQSLRHSSDRPLTLTVVQVVVPRAYYGSKTVLIMEFLRGQKLVTALQVRGVHDVRGCDLVTGHTVLRSHDRLGMSGSRR